MKNTKRDMENSNTIEVTPLDQICQEERFRILSEELIKMKPKRQIIKEYSELWQCKPSTIRALLNETMVWLSKSTDVGREEIRTLNAERLDELFAEASLRDKIKIIDILNKSYGVYDNNINVSVTKNTIDIGV